MLNNLSAYKTLRLYRLTYELQAETGEPLVLWLHRIACAVVPIMKHGPELKLLPDEKWKVSKTVKERVIAPVGNPYGGRSRYLGTREVTRWEPWEFDRSALIIFTATPTDSNEPAGLEDRLNDEGILIHRDDFLTWCKAAGFPLPHFWFSEEERQQTDATHPPLPTAEQIVECERKAGHTGNKRATLMYIVSIIDAELTGDHRLTNEEIGALFPNQPHETKEAREQRGKRLRGKKT